MFLFFRWRNKQFSQIWETLDQWKAKGKKNVAQISLVLMGKWYKIYFCFVTDIHSIDVCLCVLYVFWYSISMFGTCHEFNVLE